MPGYWLRYYQLAWWQINLDYHRRLNSFWELQSLLSLARVEYPNTSRWYPSVGLAGVRYLRAHREGFYFGGLLLLEFSRVIFREWDIAAEVFEPGFYLLVGYKHVFRSGFCINFAIAPGVRVAHTLIFSASPVPHEKVSVDPRVTYGDWDTLGFGWAF